MDRQASDDIRARQQDGSRSQPIGPPNYGGQLPPDPVAMNTSWMEGAAASPYYGAAAGRPGAGPPPHYGRPYGQQAYGDPAMASMYGRQHPYGYAPPPPVSGGDRYGYVPTHHHEMYMRHYGVPPSRGQTVGSQISPHGGIPSSASKSSPPNQGMAALANASIAQSATKSPSNASPGSNVDGETPGSKSGGEDPKSPSTPAFFGGSTESPNSSAKKASANKMKKKAVVHEVTELEDLHIDKWYSGSIPLGLEDDKYWLSELQVYLRANFAEAFGATEEDIAAPMHGRNKPIALGQVGIRCVWCKRK
jgi:hypothetical protein